MFLLGSMRLQRNRAKRHTALKDSRKEESTNKRSEAQELDNREQRAEIQKQLNGLGNLKAESKNTPCLLVYWGGDYKAANNTQEHQHMVSNIAGFGFAFAPRWPCTIKRSPSGAFRAGPANLNARLQTCIMSRLKNS